MCSRLFPTFSSIRFSVSGFMWRSLIHLDLSLVQRDRMDQFAFFCILTSSWTSTSCWKGYLFSTGCFWLLCRSSSDHRCVGSFLGLQSYSIDLLAWHCTNTIHFFYHYCSVVKFEVWDTESPWSSFTVENSFSYPGFFVIPDEFEKCSF